MSKKLTVNVSGVYSKVKSVFVKVDGTWEKVKVWAKLSSEWVKFGSEHFLYLVVGQTLLYFNESLELIGTYGVISGRSFRSMATDPDKNLYLGDTFRWVHKYDIEGNQLWSTTGHGGSVVRITIDSEGNVYFLTTERGYVTKTTPEGQRLGETRPPTGGTMIGDMGMDDEGWLYQTHVDGGLYKWRFSGENTYEEAWVNKERPHPDSYLFLDEDYCYVITYKTFYRYNKATGEMVGSGVYYNYSGVYPKIVVDDKYIYIATTSNTTGYVYVFNKNFELVWSKYFPSLIGDPNGITVTSNALYIRNRQGKVIKYEKGNGEILAEYDEGTVTTNSTLVSTPGVYGTHGIHW